MTTIEPNQTAVKSPVSTSDDRYWDAYERSVLPTEILALCAVGITISAGIGVAISAFL